MQSTTEQWQWQFDLAKERGRPGNLMILAEEARMDTLRSEAELAAREAVRQLETSEPSRIPHSVFLFSGHMIDQVDRPTPRFPAAKEPIAAAAIGSQLDELGAGPQDLAICSGACGGDLLFAEACLQRGLRLEVYLPFDVPTFLDSSVNFAGQSWQERFFTATRHHSALLHIMPDELGPTPETSDPFSRVNLWMLHTAQAWGADKTRFICLWNGQAGDGPGGTKHLIDAVQERAGQVYILDTTQLW